MIKCLGPPACIILDNATAKARHVQYTVNRPQEKWCYMEIFVLLFFLMLYEINGPSLWVSVLSTFKLIYQKCASKSVKVIKTMSHDIVI